MAYADQKMSGGKMVAIFIVVLIHAALGYAFVTGLAYQYVKKAQEKLDEVRQELQKKQNELNQLKTQQEHLKIL